MIVDRAPLSRNDRETGAVPSSQIDVRRRYSPDEEVGIIDAVQDALVTAFAIPPGDRHVRLVVHEPHRFAVPPRLEHPERYALVAVDCFAGRSTDAKRRLYREVVTRLEPFGIPTDHVTVILRESATEDWGIRGGRAACDVDLGFTVEV